VGGLQIYVRDRMKQPAPISLSRLKRRAFLSALAASTAGVALGARPWRWAAAQEATPVKYLFDGPEFDAQFLRALDTIYYGGADVGECFSTALRISDGDEAAWYREWYGTGKRVSGLAEASRAAGMR